MLGTSCVFRVVTYIFRTRVVRTRVLIRAPTSTCTYVCVCVEPSSPRPSHCAQFNFRRLFGGFVIARVRTHVHVCSSTSKAFAGLCLLCYWITRRRGAAPCWGLLAMWTPSRSMRCGSDDDDDSFVPMNEGLNSDDDGDSAASIDTEDLLDRASILSGSPRRRENNPSFGGAGGAGSNRSPRSHSNSGRTTRHHRPPKAWNSSVTKPHWPLPPGPIGTTTGSAFGASSTPRCRVVAAAPRTIISSSSPIVLRRDDDDDDHRRRPSPSSSSHGRSPAASPVASHRQTSVLTHAGAYSALEVTPIAFDKRPDGPRWPRYTASPPPPPPPPPAAATIIRIVRNSITKVSKLQQQQ